MAEPSAARFNRFSRGRTVGQAEAGVVRERIRTSVLKTDGTAASLRAIDAVFAQARADPEWEGADFLMQDDESYGSMQAPKQVYNRAAHTRHTCPHGGYTTRGLRIWGMQGSVAMWLETV